jgi:uncharacterized protein (DUF2147 family)
VTLLRSAVLLLLSCAPCAADSNSPSGLWARGDGNARVRFESCGSALCAVNEWVRPGTGDEKTGDQLVLSVSPTGPNVLAGKAFDPQRNVTYAIRIEAGERHMTTQGCILAGLLCKSMSWTHVGPAPN